MFSQNPYPNFQTLQCWDNTPEKGQQNFFKPFEPSSQTRENFISYSKLPSKNSTTFSSRNFNERSKKNKAKNLEKSIDFSTFSSPIHTSPFLGGSFQKSNIVSPEAENGGGKSFKEFLSMNLKNNKSTQMKLKKTANAWKGLAISEAVTNYNNQKYKERVSKKYRVGPAKNFSGLFSEKRSILDELQIREEVEKSKGQNLPKVSDVPLQQVYCWNYKRETDCLKYRPSAREGTTLTLIENKIYLFGGSSFKTFSDVVAYDLKKENWSKILEHEDFLARAYHSAFANKKNMVIFGGQKNFNDQTKARENLSDVRSLNTETAEWSIVRTSGDYVDPRCNHASTMIGKFFFVYGGFLSGDKISNEVFALDLTNFKWQLVDVEPELPGRVYHTATAVFSEGSNLRGVYDNIDEVVSPPSLGVQINKGPPVAQGIYIFGGLSEFGFATDELRFISFQGRKPLLQALVETNGIRPSPRYLHSMNYHQGLGYLIVYGGRNDNQFKESNPENCLKDLYLLNLSTLGWCEIHFLNNIPRSPKAGHSSIIVGTKLYIFGGSNFQENYLETVFDVIELSSSVSKDASTKESLRIKEEEEFQLKKISRKQTNKFMDKFSKIDYSVLGTLKSIIERKATMELAMLPMPLINHHLGEEECPIDSRMRDKLKLALSFAKYPDKFGPSPQKKLQKLASLNLDNQKKQEIEEKINF